MGFVSVYYSLKLFPRSSLLLVARGFASSDLDAEMELRDILPSYCRNGYIKKYPRFMKFESAFTICKDTLAMRRLLYRSAVAHTRRRT